MKKHNLSIPLAVVFFTTLIGMSLYEILKQYLHQDINLWESHAYTIIFSSVLAMVGAYFILHKREAILHQTIEEITKRKQAEELLEQRSQELDERVKELNCLYGLSKLAETSGESLDMLISGVAKLLPPAFQYPPITCARITLDGQTFSTANFEQTPWRQRRSICLRGVQRGSVEVCYLEARPACDDGPFLHQEGWLLEEVAERLGKAVERIQTQQVLRQQREELSQVSRLATIGEFAASIAHEVNQPLTAILNNAQAGKRLLSRQILDAEELHDILEDIINDDKRAGEVIHHLRSFLKRDKADLEILDIKSVTEEVLTILRHEIVDRRISITTELSLDIPRIKGDRIALEQVLMNLILNGCDAMKNTAPQQRRMHIRTSVDEADGIIVAVQDSGMGLDTKEMDRVFDPFYTTKPEGLGMGLAISKSIIAAHGGRIWAVNNPGGGATFSLTLPLYKGEAV